MKAADIRQVLRRHYEGESKAVIFEVPDGLGKGMRSGRKADAITVEFWESRGLEIEGYEIKTARSDWQRELQMPAKAEAHFARCNRWWLVTPYRANSQPPIAKIEEIPGPWGWLEVKEGKEPPMVRKKAPKLVPSVQFDKHFAFALIRAAARADKDWIADQVKQRTEGIRADFAAQVNAQAQTLAPRAAHVDEPLMAALRAAFGESLRWLGEETVLDAVRVVHQALQKSEMHTLQVTKFEKARDTMQEVVDALKKLEAKPDAEI